MEHPSEPRRGEQKLRRVLAAIGRHEPDVVVLQEVFARGGVAELLRTGVAQLGLPHFCFSGRVDSAAKKYGNVIASRWPLEAIVWSPAPRWPELIAAAMVRYPPGLVAVVGVHIPNGSRHGWEKVAALEALAKGLSARTLGTCTILAGDFNEPLALEPRFRSARAVLDGHLDGDFTDRHDVTRPRRDWQAAMEAVLDPISGGQWRGAHAIRDAGRNFETTHVTRGGKERCFDHILTSRYQFRVHDAGYDHEVRSGEPPISDHSIVWAVLSPGGEQFDDLAD